MNQNTAKIIILQGIIIHFLGIVTLSNASENIIETIQKTMPSMVTVTAKRGQISTATQKSMINRSTGQIFQPHRIQYSTLLESGTGIIINTSELLSPVPTRLEMPQK